MNILDRTAILITGTKDRKLQDKILLINIAVWSMYIPVQVYELGVI